MEFKQCEFCRKPFQYMGKSICSECMLKLDEEFIIIREYLWEHDGASIEEVSEETGVSRKTILYLLKEERLLVGDENEAASGILQCEACKKPIYTGRMCADCKKQLITELNQSISVVKPLKRLPEPAEEVSIKGLAKLQVKK